MDYLVFGLLAGSLIVIASFVVRDGLPHLSAIADGSRLSRLSRAETPASWARWCADTGLVLAAAGTLVLGVTAATLLADVGDGTGNLVVGASVAVAMVASALGAARLGQRLGMEREAELEGEAWMETRQATAARPSQARAIKSAQGVPARQAAPRTVEPPVQTVVASAGGPTAEPAGPWDDELPVWSGSVRADVAPELSMDDSSAGRPLQHAAVDPSESESVRVEAEPVIEPPSKRTVAGGLFSSPLLADIGLTPVEDEGKARFRSPLLSGLHDVGDSEEAGDEAGADLLIDEAPAPEPSGGRLRDEIDDR